MHTKGRAPSEGAAPTRIRGHRDGLTAAGDGRRAPVSSSEGVAGENGQHREGGQVAEMQRRRLLLAFTEVLAEDGLEDTRVGRVCKRAGLSRRTFYDLFEDREACFLAVLDGNIQRISQLTLTAYEQKGRWAERIRGALALLLNLFDEDPALARVCLIETLKAGPAVSLRRRLVLDALTSAVDEGREESKSGGQPPPLTGQSTVGGVVSVIHARVLEDNPGPLVELLNPLMGMIVHPYLGPAAARRELERAIPPSKRARNDQAPVYGRDPFGIYRFA